MKVNRRSFCKHSLASLAITGLAGTSIAQKVNAATNKPVEFGAMTLAYSEFSLERALEGIRKAGYQHTSVYFRHKKKTLLHGTMSTEEKKWLKQILRDSGLNVRMGLIGWDLNVTEEEGRNEYKRQLDCFAELDIHMGLTGGPWRFIHFPHERKPMKQWLEECDAFLKGLEPVAEHAHSLGITLVMKPHTGLTATAWDCLELMKRLQWPALKIAWDDGNVSFYEGLCPDTDLPDLAPYVQAWCIKDHRGGRANADFPIPGEGEIDFAKTLRILADAGFQGPACVERVDGITKKSDMSAEEIDRRLAIAYKNLTAMKI